jgi:hypothetical protein
VDVETYRRRGLWRRTLHDVVAWSRLQPAKWERRARRADAGCRQVEKQVFESRRHPTASERERPKYAGSESLQERLNRTTAFGQWANQIDDKDAQHGLFGTSAAAQVLSRSAWAKAAINGNTLDGSDAWVNEYLRTVNFIDMVVASRGSTNGVEPLVAADLGVTLRACHAARAFAAAAPVLAALSEDNDQLLRAVDNGVIDDLGGDLADVARRNTMAIMAILSDAQVISDQAPSRGYKPPGESLGLALYTFTADHDRPEDRSLPENANDWVFLHGSVLIALVRCWAAQLVRDHQEAERVCPAVGFLAFKHAIGKRASEFSVLDDRLRLFGLWALSHLDTTTPGGPFGAVNGGSPGFTPPPHLSLEANDLAALAEQIRKVCGRLLTNEIGLSDSYSPYTFWSGPKKTDYKDDSLVVPVVPLLLSLVARYVPAWLSRTQVLRLIEACTDPSARAERRLTARPYQLSTQDGVVNLSYYQEACETVAFAARNSLAALPKRLRAHTSSFIHDWGKLAVVLMFIGAAALAYTIDAVTDSTLAGFFYGILAAVLAAVLVPGFVRWLWGDL